MNQVIPVNFHQDLKSPMTITAKPAKSKWQGENLDLDYALQLLCACS